MFFLIITNFKKNFQLLTDRRHPCVSGPAQFKHMLFKGQLYFQNRFPFLGNRKAKNKIAGNWETDY